MSSFSVRLGRSDFVVSLLMVVMLLGSPSPAEAGLGLCDGFVRTTQYLFPYWGAKASLVRKFGPDYAARFEAQSEIDLSRQSLTDGELLILAAHFSPNLRRLNVSQNPDLTNRGLRIALGKIENLLRLDVSYTRVNGTIVRDLVAAAPKLTMLSLSHVKGAALTDVLGFRKLTQLDIHNSSVPTKAVQTFVRQMNSEMSKITIPRSVDFSSVTEVADSRIKEETLKSSFKINWRFPYDQVELAYTRRLNAIIDGDTIWVLTDRPYHMVPSMDPNRVKVRLNGLDTAEISAPPDSIEYRCAVAARNFTAYYLTGAGKIQLSDIAYDVYQGRIDADVWFKTHALSPWRSLNAALLSEGLAVPYGGDEKRPDTDWAAFYRTHRETIDRWYDTPARD